MTGYGFLDIFMPQVKYLGPVIPASAGMTGL
jgi:hypothetical protein